MTKYLREWSLLGMLLAEVNPAKFATVMDAVRRIADAEVVLSEAPTVTDAVSEAPEVPEIAQRFRN